MALVHTQRVQAAVVCSITLIAIALLRELAPMRHASDNHVAVLAQSLVFLYTFVFLLRIAKLFQQPVAGKTIGVLLCAATAGLFLTAVAFANSDRLKEKADRAAEQNAGHEQEPAATQLVERANDETDDMESDDQVRAAPPPQRGREAAVPSPAGASLREDEVKIDVPKEVSTDAADPCVCVDHVLWSGFPE